MASNAVRPSAPGLARTLGLWDLVFIGIIMVQPTAPMPGFGAFYDRGHGHVVTAVLIAMVPMLFTAVSYGRLARVYPSAGSAYAYVAREMHPSAGFATGWSMMLDYLLNPLICVIWCARASGSLFPVVPYPAWALLFAGLFTWTNLRRIRATARVNAALTAVMGVVILWMLCATLQRVAAMPWHGAGFFTRPFYDPQRFSWASLRGGTSLAVLTYLGFEGVTTLSEEARDPRRTIKRATVLTCLLTGVLATVQVYSAQLVWQAGRPFVTMETAYVEAARVAGGPILAVVLSVTLVVANFGSGAGAQLSGARILYGMGVNQALPKRFFGTVNPHSQVPANNVILIGVFSLLGAFVFNYEQGAELLNFGALLAFMGVNLAAFLRFYWRNASRTLLDAAMPLTGFAVCLGIWWNLSDWVKLTGAIWIAAGLAYVFWRTRGLNRTVLFEAPGEF